MIVAVDDNERTEVAAAISFLLDGFQLAAVEYLIPPTMFETKLTKGRGFEHAEAGVSLVNLGGERRTFRWSSHGIQQGLWVGEGLPQDSSSWVPDVSLVAAPSWRRLLGSRIEMSAVGWQEIAPAHHSIWTVRLDLGLGSVAIALGEREYESGSLTYIPDCVVVIFDKEVGEGYRPSASSAPAWANREPPSNG